MTQPSALSALQSELAETRRRLAEAEQALVRSHASALPNPEGVAIIDAQAQITAEFPGDQRFFRAVFEHSVVSMARVSAATGRFAQVNGAFCDLVGYSMEEAAQLAPLDITFAEDRVADASVIAAIRRGESDSYDVQKRYVHKDGRLIWVHVRATVVRDAQGNAEGTFSTIEDITQRKATEQALRESEARFRAAFANSSLPMSIISQAKAAYVDVNQACADLFGLAREAMIGRAPAELELYADPATRPMLRSLLVRDGFVRDHEVLWRARDGQLRWHLLSADPMVLAGEPCLFVVSHDITARKEAEARLLASEEFNRTVLEASPDCLKVIDADGRLEFLNENGACLLEIDDRAVMLGEKWETLWPASAHDTIRNAIAAALAGRAVNFSAEAPTMKGTPRIWEVAVAPVPGADGQPTKLIAASRDVTALRHGEEQLHNRLNEIEALYDNTPIGMALFDRDLRCVRINKAIGGTDFSIGRFVWDIFPMLRTAVEPLMQHVLQTGAMVAAEVAGALPGQPGIPKVWSAKYYPLKTSDGAIVAIGATIDDVTERKEAENRLRGSEARFRAAVQAVDGIVWTNNAAGEMSGEQPGWSALTGQTRGEYEGFGWSQAVHPDDAQPTIDAWSEAVAAKSLFEFEHRVRCQDGEWRHFSIRAAPTFDKEDRIVEWVGVHRDITKRKAATDALRESEALLQQALSAARAGLWSSRPEQGAFDASDRALALYGLPPETKMTHELALAAVHLDDRAQVEIALRDTVEHGAPFRIEMRAPQPDGSTRWLLSQAERRDTGQLVGLVQDITEQKDREARIQLLMGEVNHRSKNMLGVVMAVARQTGGPDQAAFVQRFSERIQSLAAGQDLLVNSQWKGVLLDDLVRAQLGHFKDLIGGRITLAGSAVLISAAAAQTIGMALHELATNASKYGALSVDQGRVAIAWQLVDGSGAAGRFVMSWTESDGPPVVAPKRKGFGTTVIGRMVKMSLDCDATADFAPSGFSWRIDCPAQKVLEEKHSSDQLDGELS